ncbi:hypothetical protein HYZ99_00690 [Candidatus Peregrinibacteria bacterium]|nr:hypothetical protein [Candidatus Peregrinibacteria bacterium]
MRRLIAIAALEVHALLLAWMQSLGGGVRTDEAKYLLNIPYPQPPLARTVLGWTEGLAFQEILWRVIFATLLIQAVWLVWDIGRNLSREHRFILAAGWLLSTSVLFQAGTVMMAPLTALFGLLFVWLALNRSPSASLGVNEATGSGVLLRERGSLFVVGMLWLAALFTAYQGILYMLLVWTILRRRHASLLEKVLYLGLPIALVALYTLTNPLAIASFVNAGGENLNIPFALWGAYLVRLWITGGSLALTILGIFGLLRSRNVALLGSFILVSVFCFVSFREYYDILFTPLFIGGAALFLRHSRKIPLVPFLIVLVGTTAIAARLVPPIIDLGPAREVMRAIEARDQPGDVLIHKYFGHAWQWESNLPIRRFAPELAKDAQAVICINPCEGFDPRGWQQLPDLPVEVWMRE